MRAVGRLPATAGPGAWAGSRGGTRGRGRLPVSDVWVERQGRVCRLPALSVSMRGARGIAGAPGVVGVTGAWVPYAASGSVWPRAPERLGFLRSAGSATADSAARADLRRLAPGPPGLLGRWSRRLRGSAAARLRARLAPDVWGTGLALLLADRGELEPETRRVFAEAGVSHLLAISGLHVGILAVVATWLAGLIAPERRFGIAAILVLGFVTVIGAPPAALRAALLFVGYAVSRRRGAPASLGDLMGGAAIAALLLRPMSLLDPGFQLSFSGFAGLGLGMRVARWSRVRRRVPRVARGGLAALAASTGAFLFTAPVAAAHFGRLAPVSVPASLAGAPIVAASLCGLLGAAALPGGAGELAGLGATVTLRALSGLAALARRVPLGHADAMGPGSLGWLVIAGLGCAVLAGLAARSRTPALTVLAGVAALWAATPALRRWETARATLLCTLDVGQGDAAAVRTRHGRWLVIDAGPRGRTGSSRGVAEFLRSHGGGRIAALILTHPHADHIGGAAQLLRTLRVDRVIDAGNPVPEPAYASVLDLLAERGIRWSEAEAGALLRVDEVSVRILGPKRRGGPGDSWPAVGANEGSVSLRLSVAGSSFAYVNTGDAYRAQERGLLRLWPADSVRAALLKLGHHGSRTSTSVAWLRAVRPSLVAISVGRGNGYGHPHAETLRALDDAGIPRQWRTDRDGTLCVSVERSGGWRIGPP